MAQELFTWFQGYIWVCRVIMAPWQGTARRLGRPTWHMGRWWIWALLLLDEKHVFNICPPGGIQLQNCLTEIHLEKQLTKTVHEGEQQPLFLPLASSIKHTLGYTPTPYKGLENI